MTLDEFLEKYDLMDEKINILNLAGFLATLDFFYCTRTKEQTLEIVSAFYDNADGIYNSLAKTAKSAQELLSTIKEELENMNGGINTKKNKHLA